MCLKSTGTRPVYHRLPLHVLSGDFDKPDKMNEKGKRFFGMRIWHEMFIHKLLSLEIKERKRKKQKTKQNY